MSMRIFFDMDGVLADFYQGTVDLPPVSVDLNLQTKQMDDAGRAAKRARWRMIEQRPHFWRDLPVMSGIDDLLRTAAQRGELYVLTKVPGAKNFVGSDAYVDFIDREKRAWIARHMPHYFDDTHVIVVRGAKEDLIHPTSNDLLIDDRAGNIADWCAAGGRGIVFENPCDTIKQLTLGDF